MVGIMNAITFHHGLGQPCNVDAELMLIGQDWASSEVLERLRVSCLIPGGQMAASLGTGSGSA
jgi:hypothetical protein